MIVQPELSKPIYDQLKQMINEGHFKPGQKLVQEELAKTLGVSRTPLLKALQALEHEMIVESKPRRGMYVKEISLEEMIDVYDCREGIECTAVRLVIERSTEKEKEALIKIFDPFLSEEDIDMKKYGRADEKFHDMIIDLAKNPTLKRMSTVSNIHKRVYIFGLIRPPHKTMQEHMAIIQAIKENNVTAAVAAMKNHIELSKKILIDKLNSKNENL